MLMDQRIPVSGNERNRDLDSQLVDCSLQMVKLIASLLMRVLSTSYLYDPGHEVYVY